MAGWVHIPWYATGLRGDQLESALRDVTPSALHYGATAYFVHRSRDDRYRFLQAVRFEDKLSFERWWEGPEMVEYRAITSSWWQVPVLYVWNDVVAEGAIAGDGGNGNGTAPEPAPAPEPAEAS